MKTSKRIASVCLLLLSIFAASCSAGQPSGAPLPPPTAPPIASPIPRPTLTTTSTVSPTPSPTPVPGVGDTLRSNIWEATVLEAVFRKSISIAGTTYVSKPGDMTIDVILQVKNLNPGTDTSIVVANDVIVDEQGTTWLPACWGALAVAKAQPKDLLNLTFAGCRYGKFTGDTMNMSSESYLRFDFGIKATSLGKTITFKFEDLPAVSFIINQ